MKWVFTFTLAIILASLTSTAFARSGCCSHHGGVCGCGCCDGSGLSTKCAPYYPECSRGTAASTYRTVDTCSVSGLYEVYMAHKARGEKMTGLSGKTWWNQCPLSVRQAVNKLVSY
jgi:hypothetical protein